LEDPVATAWLFSSYQPEYVFLSAAKVGGIVANSTTPVEFMAQNLRIQLNVLESAYRQGVKKLLFLGSACAYPKLAENPIKESALLTGALEPSNECYALAKIAGIRLCEAYRRQYGCDFISVMPTNLYGIGDNYDPENSHVLPGMIRRLDQCVRNRADVAVMWGSGKPVREFLFSDDLARACVLLMQEYRGVGLVNAGSGDWIKLSDLATLAAQVIGFRGRIEWDAGRPDGTPIRYLDNSILLDLGWRPEVDLAEGIRIAHEDFKCRKR
jgi:GDP-L-fucose synthase